jgi:hypothetical protein
MPLAESNLPSAEFKSISPRCAIAVSVVVLGTAVAARGGVKSSATAQARLSSGGAEDGVLIDAIALRSY